MKIKQLNLMKLGKTSYSFRGSFQKDALISSSARININNSTTGFLRVGMPHLFGTNDTSSHLSDLKKTFLLNVDLLKKYISLNNNPINKDNQLISTLNAQIFVGHLNFLILKYYLLSKKPKDF